MLLLIGFFCTSWSAKEHQMTDTLSITSSQAQNIADVTIFYLSGTLDSKGEEVLCEQAKQAFDGGAKSLLLDMIKLKYISSAGLRALHNIFQMCTPKEEIIEARENDELYKSPYFKLAGANPDVYGVLNIAGFLHSIPFYFTMDEAIESYTT